MRRFSWVLGVCLLWARLAGSAWAGPPELFRTVVPGSNADALAIYYEYGGGGFYFSRDAGKSFELLCSTAVQSDLADGQVWALNQRPDGRVNLGLFSGMLLSDERKCSWSRVAQFEGRWVSDIARDPEDAAVSYAVTSSGEGDNAMYRNDGKSDEWTRIGEAKPDFLTRLFIVKTESGVRMYQSAAMPAQSSSQKPRYYVRVSDDRGQTWTDHDFGETDGSMRVLAVDPSDPDRIAAVVQRPLAMQKDDILVSTKRGEPGSFQKIGQALNIVGVAFTPDGALFYGDNDQMSPALFKLDKGASEPRMLSNEYKVSCLRYDPAQQRLYVCRDWMFGTADPSSGKFSVLADMRKSERFVSCPEEQDTATRCETQFRLNYCGPGHYEDAPICHFYPGAANAGAGGSSGLAGSGAGVSAAGSGAGSEAAGMSAPKAGSAGMPRAGSSGATPEKPARSSGCSAGLAGSAPSSAWLWGMIGYACLRRSQRRRRSAQAASR
ncbi:MAG TPA: hypothetical protein VJV78_36655 [Polyangiales bacterium]|nr:hypothetical protein [Polyangiales bacterium]